MFEAKRHYGIVDARLAQHKFMLGDSYTIVDMALWGWARLVPFVLGDDAALGKLPNLKRLLDTIDARPAAQRALALKDRHTFKAEFDDEARRNMFRHTVQPA
jgi:GST-like protein